jgi:hypothetical protein
LRFINIGSSIDYFPVAAAVHRGTANVKPEVVQLASVTLNVDVAAAVDVIVEVDVRFLVTTEFWRAIILALLS